MVNNIDLKQIIFNCLKIGSHQHPYPYPYPIFFIQPKELP